MRLTWHIVAKDTLRLRLPVALWVLLLVVKQGVQWRVAHMATEDLDEVNRLKAFVLVLSIVGYFVSYVLAAAVVKEDTPTGAAEFWMTRPISGARLLGAKLLGCAVLLCLLPVLVALPWWLADGRGGPGILLAARETGWWQACIVAPGLAVAALTRTPGQFLTWTVALQIAGVWAWAYWQGKGGKLIEGMLAAGGGASAGLKFALALALVGPAAAVIVQYVTRRPRLSLVILGGTMGGAATIAARVLL